MNGIAQIIVSLATLITAIGSVLVSLRNGKKLDATATKVDEAAEATKEVSGKIDVSALRAAIKADEVGKVP